MSKDEKKTLFQINYWYSSKDTEIFLDLDSNRAIARALSVLRLTLKDKHLNIRAIWLYQTETPGHAHMIIVLRWPLTIASRLAWSLWLGNDRLRVAYVIQRVNHYVKHADLLKAPYRYYRAPDQICYCPEKHKDPKVTENCPAMTALLGMERSADYFMRTGKAPPKRKIRIPWGKVSLKQLKNWSPIYEREQRLLQDQRPVEMVRGLDDKGEENKPGKFSSAN